MGLAVPALAGYPALQVVHADFGVAHITGTNIYHTIGQLERLHQFFRVCNQLLVPAYRFLVVGVSDHVLFDLVELVDTEDASCILAIGACLFTKTGTETYEGQRQILIAKNLVLVHASDRDFGGTYQESVFSLDSIDLVASLGELPIADKAEFSRHGWYDQWRKTFACNAIHGEIHQCQFEARGISFKCVAARASNLDSSFDVYHVQLLHQGIVVEWFKAEYRFLSPFAYRYVVVFVLADGGAGIRDIWYEVK